MKKYLVFAAAASLFAACSNDDGAVAGPQQEAQQTAGEVAVAFDSYVNRATTRAGKVGAQDLDAIKAEKVGFGVFAYYTNADNYDQSFTPNFMYNQQVTFSGTGDAAKWSYTPIKYWPNEYGTGALSEDADKVSFFAYAPYVSVNPASGKVIDKSTGTGSTYTEDNGDITSGIVGMKNNSATGDPMVKYISSFYTNQQVDLTWGTVGNADVTWYQKKVNATPANTTQTIDAYKPWLNVQHPKETSNASTDNRVKFNFNHALAALNVTVDTKTNGTTAVAPETDTKVYIRSVTFEGFDVKGALNLNNTKTAPATSPTAAVADWYNFDCLSELNNGSEITIQDGRKDGKEGVTAATKENAFINPNFVQSTVFTETGTGIPTGVTGTAANLFGLWNSTDNKIDVITGEGAANKPIYVIPNGDPLKVTIEYDVLTKDGNLAGTLNDGQTKGSVVKNVITRYITAGSDNQVNAPATGSFKLENGKLYKITLHLGLNSVEFDATVENWPTDAVTGTADLPHNNPSTSVTPGP